MGYLHISVSHTCQQSKLVIPNINMHKLCLLYKLFSKYPLFLTLHFESNENNDKVGT